MENADRQPARVGRKRDPSRDVAILDATLTVLADRGYAGLTIDLVAATAGAGKATVYRRWPAKADLVLDAVAHLDAGRTAPGVLPDTGTLRGDLHALLDRGNADRDERRMRIMAGLTSMIAEHPALGEAADTAVVGPWATANAALIRRAVERGEVSPRADVDTLARVVPTMVAYRACIQRLPIPDGYVASLIDRVLLPALGVPPA